MFVAAVFVVVATVMLVVATVMVAAVVVMVACVVATTTSATTAGALSLWVFFYSFVVGVGVVVFVVIGGIFFVVFWGVFSGIFLVVVFGSRFGTSAFLAVICILGILVLCSHAPPPVIRSGQRKDMEQ